MDPFTQRMLERAKLRREKLDMHMSHKSETDNHSALNKLTDMESSSKNIGSESNNAKQGLTSMRKIKLKKLAQFYSGNTDEMVLCDNVEEDNEEINDVVVKPAEIEDRKSICKSKRLADLATKINEWQDDLDFNRTEGGIRSNCKAPVAERKSLTEKGNSLWNQSMIEKLCSQGFSLSESKSKLTYEFGMNKKQLESQKEEKKKEILKANTEGKMSVVKPTDVKMKHQNLISSKVAFFEQDSQNETNIQVKDPAELTLAERKALFEKKNGAQNLRHGSGLSNSKTNNLIFGSIVSEKVAGIQKLINCENKENMVSDNIFSASGNNDKNKHTEWNTPRNKDVNEIAIPNQEPCLKESNEEDMESFHNQNQVPKPPPMPIIESSTPTDKHNLSHNEISFQHEGRLYPSLSTLDVVGEKEMSLPESESFNESKNSNFYNNLSFAELLEINKNNPVTPPSEQSFSKSKECQVLNKMDRLLESALNDLSSSCEDNDDVYPSPPKMMKSSSFEFKNLNENNQPLLHTVSFYRKQQQQNNSYDTDKITENNALQENESAPIEDENGLVENKIQNLSTEVNKQQTIISQASQALNLCLSTVEFSGSGEQVEGERLLLLATYFLRKTITSSIYTEDAHGWENGETFENKGFKSSKNTRFYKTQKSFSHKRQACLNEIQRLKIEKTLKPQGKNNYLSEKGDVTLSSITLKLKRDALRAMAVAESLQYFVCLVKSDEQVLATPVVPASREHLKDLNLEFPGQIKLQSLLSSFKVSVEVYFIEVNKELLPHDIKYHIANKKDKKLLTPIKSKKSESKLVKPYIQSPAGPNAVRSSAFQMCGYIVFSLREISRRQWTLNKVPYSSPLEGSLSMVIQSELQLDDEFRGFLTMFDDISGFGAWHRRWCLLSAHVVSYWKYPDDEQKKIPLGTIDLKSVVTETVGLVSRDICARLHTFLLETTRPRMKEDKDSLVLSVQGEVTTIRHLLSADSKQEMTIWCKKLNTAIALLRSWKCNVNS